MYDKSRKGCVLERNVHTMPPATPYAESPIEMWSAVTSDNLIGSAGAYRMPVCFGDFGPPLAYLPIWAGDVAPGTTACKALQLSRLS
jgi:hypothetical protein